MLSDAGRDRLYAQRRAHLVDTLHEKGIDDEAVLEAVGRVERHRFVDRALWDHAYEDRALPIGLEQTISQPFTVATQTALLDVQPDDRILEIGTGSGYQAAVLCEIGARVFSVERHRDLHERAKRILHELGYRPVLRHGDGTLGWSASAPFDGIVVTAGAPVVPPALIQQLRPPPPDRRGGRLVIPVGDRSGQVMKVIERTGPEPSDVDEMDVGVFQFVPLVKGRASHR